MKESAASGDPCSQPTQLKEQMLHPCTNATKLSYFDGSKGSFTVFILLLFLFPAGECGRTVFLHSQNCETQQFLIISPHS